MLNLIVAHAAEARPLIQHFKLQRQHDVSAFVVYQGEELQLVQSGAGKIAAAAATGFAAAGASAGSAAWLNLGIAGHRDREVGEALVAHKVVDAESGDTWYPQILWDAPCPTDTIVTCSRPDLDYQAGGAIDMEASGYVCAAMRAAPAELVHCLKIVSDTPRKPVTADTRALAPDLIAAQLPAIEILIGRLQNLSVAHGARRQDPPGYADLTARFHFTATQRQRLKRLLTRFAVLLPEDPMILHGLNACRGSAEVVQRLESLLNDAPGRGLP